MAALKTHFDGKSHPFLLMKTLKFHVLIFFRTAYIDHLANFVFHFLIVLSLRFSLVGKVR